MEINDSYWLQGLFVFLIIGFVTQLVLLNIVCEESFYCYFVVVSLMEPLKEKTCLSPFVQSAN